MLKANGDKNRSLIGIMLERNLPGLYKFVTQVRLIVLTPFINKKAFITDSLGGSFKHYFKQRGFLNVKTEFLEGLDEQSKEEMSIIVDRLFEIPDHSEVKKKYPKYKLFQNSSEISKLTSSENKIKIKEIGKYIGKKWKNITEIKMEPSVWYYYHGLHFFSSEVKKYLKDQIFIDIGAYNGDSAIALAEYQYKKIYSFDISEKSLALYNLNLKKYVANETKYQSVLASVGDSSGTYLLLKDTGSPGLSTKRNAYNSSEIKVPQIRLDEFCNQNNISPKLIKADMEGSAMEFLNGALDTIVKSKPILLIAIYHNPIEFFEIKNLIKNNLTDYSLIIRKLSPYVIRNECHSEVFLIAYPKEIELQYPNNN